MFKKLIIYSLSSEEIPLNLSSHMTFYKNGLFGQRGVFCISIS